MAAHPIMRFPDCVLVSSTAICGCLDICLGPGRQGSQCRSRDLTDSFHRADKHDKPPPRAFSACKTALTSVFRSGVPGGLAAATQLRHLAFCDPFEENPIGLTAADVVILSSLPALATLGVLMPAAIEADLWDVRVETLRSGCVAQGHASPVICRPS